VSPREAWEIVAAELAGLAGHGPVTLIAGNGLDLPAAGAGDGDVTVAAAPGGQPATGAWWRLAGELPRLRDGRLLLADYDPVLGYLCTASVAAAPSAGAGQILGTHTPRDDEEESRHVSCPSLPADHGTLSR
jgi:hypothetical protein